MYAYITRNDTLNLKMFNIRPSACHTYLHIYHQHFVCTLSEIVSNNLCNITITQYVVSIHHEYVSSYLDEPLHTLLKVYLRPSSHLIFSLSHYLINSMLIFLICAV